MLFLSCKANARVKLAKSEHRPHLFRIIVVCVVLVIVLCYCLYAVLLLLCCTVIVLLCYYLCCPMYWLCVLYHCHRVLTQLQLTNISYHSTFAKRNSAVWICPNWPERASDSPARVQYRFLLYSLQKNRRNTLSSNCCPLRGDIIHRFGIPLLFHFFLFVLFHYFSFPSIFYLSLLSILLHQSTAFNEHTLLTALLHLYTIDQGLWESHSS